MRTSIHAPRRHPPPRPLPVGNIPSFGIGFISVSLLGLLLIGASSAEDCTPSANVSEIAAGVYARQGQHAVVFENKDIANVGFVVGNRCVAVIDTGGSIAEGRALRCAIKHATPRPVCFVINTHVHPDHILGNLAFQSDNVTFVGHAKLPRALALLGSIYLQRAAAQAGQRLGPEHIVAPDRTVQEAIDPPPVFPGSRRVEFRCWVLEVP